jgi:hypothetical protein
MLTIFTTPKPFRGHFAVIQRNAIRSWTLLRPACEVILFGDEEGTKTIASDFGLRHIPDVDRNEYGTPLVSDLFEKSQRLGAHDILCYVNCDIILMSDFIRAIQRVISHKRRFLLVGQRWNLNVNEELDFRQEWEEKLQAQVRENGSLGHPSGIDYFVFNRGLWGKIPPFAVGRAGWDNWMLYRARSLHATLIDATPVTTVVHQNHDYSHLLQGEDGVYKSDEAKQNLALLDHHGLTTEDATHLLTAEKLRLTCDQRHLWRHLATLPILYPSLRLPVRILSKALSVSYPLRSLFGLTFASSRIKSPDE